MAVDTVRNPDLNSLSFIALYWPPKETHTPDGSHIVGSVTCDRRGKSPQPLAACDYPHFTAPQRLNKVRPAPLRVCKRAMNNVGPPPCSSLKDVSEYDCGFHTVVKPVQAVQAVQIEGRWAVSGNARSMRGIDFPERDREPVATAYMPTISRRALIIRGHRRLNTVGRRRRARSFGRTISVLRS